MSFLCQCYYCYLRTLKLEHITVVIMFFFSGLFRATHGTSHLSTEEIIKHYGPKREWKHFNSLNTSFTRSGIHYEVIFILCAVGFFFFFSYLDFFVLITFVLILTAKYYFYDNYFDLPGALLCGRVVDMLNKVVFHFQSLNVICSDF